MFVRIMKFTFKPEKAQEFIGIYNRYKKEFSELKGCTLLEIHPDKTQKDVLISFSYWTEEQALNLYRNSDFYHLMWAQSRKLFKIKPEVWIVDSNSTSPDIQSVI